MVDTTAPLPAPAPASSEAQPAPNTRTAIAARVAGGTIAPRTVWLMLGARPALFLASQALFALALLILGDPTPWRSAADMWLTSIVLGEAVNVWLLVTLLRREGLRYRDIFNFSRVDVRGDVLWFVGALLVTALVAGAPNILLGMALWGDPQVGADLSFRAVPVWMAWFSLVVFPLIHGATELPTYFGYVMPRLQEVTGRRSMWIVAGLVLAAQHVVLPLLFDWRFFVWRLLMFIPFALWVAFVTDRRPTILGYLAIGHVFLDLSLPIFVLQASLAAAG